MAGLDDFVEGDALHHFLADAFVLVIECVCVGVVLDDVVVALVGADEGGVGGAEEGDGGAVEADCHMQGGRVVGNNERGACDEGHEPSDVGLADEVDDARVAGSEQGLALVALAGGADDGDAVEAHLKQGAREGRELLDGPALAGPDAGGCEDGVAGAGEVGVAIDALEDGGVGVELHVAERGDAGGFDEGEHAVDAVEGRWDVVLFGQAQPAHLACVGVADAAWCAGRPGEEAAAGEALGIDDEVVVAPAEIGEECEGWAWLAPLLGASEVLAVEGDDGGDGGVAGDRAGEGGVDEPVDVCGWEGGFEARGDGD